MDILSFLVELCEQIRKRFLFSKNSVLAHLKALDPIVAASHSRSIIPLANKFPTIAKEEELVC